MGTLLDKIRGSESGSDSSPDNDPDNSPEIPDGVPPQWSGLDSDPEPAPGGGPAPALAPTTYGRVTPTMQRKLADQIAMYIDLLAMPVALRDECGVVVQDQAEALGKAFAKILARYPEAAHKMLSSGVLGDWIAVGLAAKPIAEAVWQHHIVRADVGGPDDLADFPDLDDRPGR